MPDDPGDFDDPLAEPGVGPNPPLGADWGVTGGIDSSGHPSVTITTPGGDTLPSDEWHLPSGPPSGTTPFDPQHNSVDRSIQEALDRANPAPEYHLPGLLDGGLPHLWEQGATPATDDPFQLHMPELPNPLHEPSLFDQQLHLDPIPPLDLPVHVPAQDTPAPDGPGDYPDPSTDPTYADGGYGMDDGYGGDLPG